MSWLPISIFATLIYTLILTLTFLYLYSTEKDKTLLLFSLSWGLYSLRFIFMLLYVSSRHPFWLIANQAMVLLSSHLLFTAFQKWLHRRISPLPLNIITLFLLLWLPAAAVLALPLPHLSLPIFFYVGALYIAAGIMLVRSRIYRSPAKAILAVTLIVWGLHKMDYPFLRPVEWFAPWGYLLGSLAAILTGITTILIYLNVSQRSLEKALKERETLIKEIQHRVKNNLAILHSLIRFQAKSHASEPRIQEIFTRLENKVFTFALIQQHLYKSNSLDSLDFKDYLTQLTQHVLESFGESPGILEIQYRASQINTSPDFSKSLGLIITEALTNSIKYAFPSRPASEKRISLRIQEAPPKRWTVDIRDNGVGLPEDFQRKDPKMSGLFLIQMLAEDLDAQVKISSEGGARIWLSLPQPPRAGGSP